jgi:hypothetical protein
MTALALVRYQDIPGIELLHGIGQKVLGLALLAYVLVESFKLVRGGKPDFAGPIMRVAVGFIVVSAIPWIGTLLATTSLSVAGSMMEESTLTLFGRAIGTALESTTCDETGISATLGLLFSFKGWISILSSVVYIAMYLAKFLVIDVLFPVCFGLVLFLGVLSVPISVFPGTSTLSGWAKNLIEVSLWPIIFQFLVAMLAATFPMTIAAMADGHVVLDCGSGGLDTAGAGGGVVGASGLAGQPTGFVAVLQFLSICVAYIIMLLFTPFISAIVMRSAPVSVMGGIMAAKAGALVGMVVTKAGAAAGGLATAGAGGGSAAGGGAGAAGASSSPAQKLDARGGGSNHGGGAGGSAGSSPPDEPEQRSLGRRSSRRKPDRSPGEEK